MCVSRYLLYVGFALVPMAIICIVSNILLLFPEMTYHFLLDGHVTREATWATGLWASGFLVRSWQSERSCVKGHVCVCFSAAMLYLTAVWFQVLLGANAFIKRSRTRGFVAARTQVSSTAAAD